MKKYITLLLGCEAIAALTGCNTVDGVGEDVEDLGQSMQEASE